MRRELLRLVQNSLGAHSGLARFIWHYGSRRPDSDIDLLVVLDSVQPKAYHGPVGHLDMTEISSQDFETGLSIFDPAITEAVLTGQLIWGDSTAVVEHVQFLRTHSLDSSAIETLRERSLRNYKYAREYLAHAAYVTITRTNGSPSQSLELAIANLSFALSYLEFARYYMSHHKGAITFCQLMHRTQSVQLRRVMNHLKLVRRGQRPSEFKSVESLLDAFQPLF
ncbi:nucleotidyltransferase domain-containing protein [Patescibacteria group bacterium]|nr:nucleotidyltransferase domain-containing protein [Patescibacteria group bacterium]MBU1890839.1 nucleotidyltransferase domain-containing protein [Patescibacteria group bacterium]